MSQPLFLHLACISILIKCSPKIHEILSFQFLSIQTYFIISFLNATNLWLAFKLTLLFLKSVSKFFATSYYSTPTSINTYLLNTLDPIPLSIKLTKTTFILNNHIGIIHLCHPKPVIHPPASNQWSFSTFLVSLNPSIYETQSNLNTSVPSSYHNAFSSQFSSTVSCSVY